MSPQRIAGIVLMAAGLILLIVGFNASESVADQASNFFTGKFTKDTMWYLIGGAVMAIAGFALLFLGGRSAGR